MKQSQSQGNKFEMELLYGISLDNMVICFQDGFSEAVRLAMFMSYVSPSCFSILWPGVSCLWTEYPQAALGHSLCRHLVLSSWFFTPWAGPPNSQYFSLYLFLPLIKSHLSCCSEICSLFRASLISNLILMKMFMDDTGSIFNFSSPIYGYGLNWDFSSGILGKFLSCACQKHAYTSNSALSANSLGIQRYHGLVT